MKLSMKRAKRIMLESGGSLYLSGTGITALPDGLTVGGWLDLSGTGITALPDSLTVGGYLDLSGTGIKNYRPLKLRDGDYEEGRYLYCDGILTHVKKRKIVNGYTYFVGKIPGRNVVSNGKYYAHCDKWRDGIKDLLFKSAADRGAEQYKLLSLDAEMDVDSLVTMYRVITGACRQGSQSFVDSLGDALKPKYTIREAINLTRGQFGAEQFETFFSQDS